MIGSKLIYEQIFVSFIDEFGEMYPREYFVTFDGRFNFFALVYKCCSFFSFEDFLSRIEDASRIFQDLGDDESQLWTYLSQPTEELRERFGYESATSMRYFIFLVKENLYQLEERFEVDNVRLLSFCADPQWSYPVHKRETFAKLVHCIHSRLSETFGRENLVLTEQFMRGFPDLPLRIMQRILQTGIEYLLSDWILFAYQSVNDSQEEGVLTGAALFEIER